MGPPEWGTIAVDDNFQISLHRRILLRVWDLSHGQLTPQWGCKGTLGSVGSSSVPSPRNALPPLGCSWDRGSPPAQDQGAVLGHISLDLPWWTRGCNCRSYRRKMVGQGTVWLFILRQTSLKGCVLHEETFIVEKAWFTLMRRKEVASWNSLKESLMRFRREAKRCAF